MQYNVKTPAEYLTVLEDDWRKETLQNLREIILTKAPGINERIQYKMLCYGDENSDLFHLNAQKNYVSLYVGNISKIDSAGELLKGLNKGKGCIRFSKSKVIADTRIDQFIERAIELWHRGKDTGC